MTCHVLHAGDGYTYLTNSVATGDVERSAHDRLVDYYTAHGTPPGRWVGSGCADLGMVAAVAGEQVYVSEEHMLALFGEGLHPEANRLIKEAMDAGKSYAQALNGVRLGRRFYQFTEPRIPLVGAVRAAYEQFESDRHRRPTVEERRDIKTRVAGDLLAERDGVRPEPVVVRRYVSDELGKARQPVAGFDLVFSPVKSVSVLWALGGPDVRQVVEQVHEVAWRAALAYGEREAGYTRTGAGGIAQIDTTGFVATAFDHRDSRAGDPDLHTHVAVANRALGADGQWRTLDSQQMHKVAVSMSETYNAALEQGLTERLGAGWVEVSKGAGKRGVRELAGMPTELISGFSRRRAQVETGYDELVAGYVARYGHTPPRTVQMRLAQQATLAGRPAKQELRSLAEQVSDWRQAAEAMLPVDALDVALAAMSTVSAAAAAVMPEPVTTAEVTALAARVVDVVSEHRAVWTVYHVRAEAIRQLKPLSFATGAQRQAVTEQVVDAALGGSSGSLELGLTPPPGPTLLQRANGESIYQRHGSTRYTSHAILDAETRLLNAAARAGGPVVAPVAARAAIAGYQTRTGRTLNPGQRRLVEQFLSCGRELAVGIGPPGAGKSTVMAAVRAGWETTGGRVLGFAPSAAAAQVLGEELGVPADTVARLLHLHDTNTDTGAEVDAGVDVRAGDMLLVDEAGMAGTRSLDRIVAIAAQRGAVVRLVGDYRQLAAVEAGGALRLIHHQAGGTELTEVHRFTDPAEAAAVLQLRIGDQAAVGFYAGAGRLHGGTRATVLDELYRDWQADTATGVASIMISDSGEVARELSQRAQTDRRAAGQAEMGGVELHNGATAGVGDRVVTRRNARRFAVLGGADYVKNGDLWDVLRRDEDGALTVRHVRHGGRITLPADYVGEHLELGYAATIHRAQGLTVQTSRAYLSPMATREAALVGLSRGTEANHAYLDTETVLATDEPDTLPGDLFYRHRDNDRLDAALATIIRREGAQRSATEQLRDALDAPHRLDTLVPQYLHALSVYRGPDAAADAAGWVAQALPDQAGDVVADPAWPALAATLLQLRDAGADPVALLSTRAGQRPLQNDPADPARSVAQVLHHRLAPDLVPHLGADLGAGSETWAGWGAGRPAGLPGWVPAPPVVDPDQGPEFAELGTWLWEQAAAIAARVVELGERAATTTSDTTPDTAPAWTVHLGPRPDDPLARATWTERAGHVAAYRERFGVHDDVEGLLPGGEHGDAARARAWVEHHLSTPTRPTTGPTTGPTAEPAVREPTERETAERETAERETPAGMDLSPEATWARMDHWHAEYAEHADRDLEPERAEPDRAGPDRAGSDDAEDDRRFAERAARVRDAHDAVRDAVRRDEQRAQTTAVWRARPHARLSGPQLDTALAQQRTRAQTAAQDRDRVAARRDRLSAQIAAGHGPRAAAVTERVARLGRLAELASQHTQITRERRQVLDRAAATAREAAHREHDAAHLTRWQTMRHPGLHDRLSAEAAALHAETDRAHATAARLAEQAAALQARAAAEQHAAAAAARARDGDRVPEHARNAARAAQMFETVRQPGLDRLDAIGEPGREPGREPVRLTDYRYLADQARRAARDQQRDLDTAHAHDQRDLTELDTRVGHLDRVVETAQRTVADLQAEQTVRENLDPDQQIIETGLRITAHQQQILTDRAAAQRADHEALLSPHRYPAYTPPDLGRDGPSLGR